jgi:hypothetical protein
MMTNEKESLAVLPAGDDGGPRDIETAELTRWKNELEHLAHHAGYAINQRHAEAAKVRECLWEGKSPDGRKHADALDGAPAFPFEGASDASVRLADMVINEKVIILLAAALRARPTVTGLELHHAALGHKLSTLMNWVIANKLGAEYVRELLRLANYVQADSPAVGVLGVWWNQEPALELKTITMQELAATLVQTYGLPPERVAELEAMLMNPDRDKETAEALMEVVDHISAKRARKMVKELRETQQADYPCPYLRKDEPRLVAYRLMEDIFAPLNLSDPKRSPYYFMREWLTETELRARIVTHRYEEEFVEEVLKHEGESAFQHYERDASGGLMQTELSAEGREDRRGKYEIWTPIYWAVTEDNIPGLFYQTFHPSVKVAAHDRRLLEYQHGEYPFTWFSREYHTNRLMDARGIPELLAGEQMTQKLLVDSFNDHVSLATVPPVKVPSRMSKVRLVIGPLKKIEEKRPGEIEFMNPPQYPAANQVAFTESQKRVDEYFGRLTERVPATLAQIHMQHESTLFLASLTDALTQMLQLCQQFIGDDELELICGDDGVPIARSREEIQGKFRVELTFDPRHLDMEYVKQLADVIKSFFVPMDTENTIMRNELLSFLFGAVNPMLAKRTLRPAQGAQQNEMQDEKKNAALIQGNYEPEMAAEGQNFQLRLDTLLTVAESDPEYLQKLTPMAQEIFAARVKHLFHQVQQQQNALTGRAVGQPVFGNPQLMQLESRVQRIVGNASNGGQGRA